MSSGREAAEAKAYTAIRRTGLLVGAHLCHGRLRTTLSAVHRDHGEQVFGLIVVILEWKRGVVPGKEKRRGGEGRTKRASEQPEHGRSRSVSSLLSRRQPALQMPITGQRRPDPGHTPFKGYKGSLDLRIGMGLIHLVLHAFGDVGVDVSTEGVVFEMHFAVRWSISATGVEES